MSYGSMDRATSDLVAQDLGIQMDYHVDILGGGNSTETIIGAAIGALEGGLADAIIVYRTMNGYTGRRIGGTPVGPAPPPAFMTAQGDTHAAHGDLRHRQRVADVRALVREAHARVRHDAGAAGAREGGAQQGGVEQPRAYYKTRFTVEDVINSRLIVWPFGLLHCCVETDNANALIVTDMERRGRCATGRRRSSERPAAPTSTGPRITGTTGRSTVTRASSGGTSSGRTPA